MEEIQAFEYLSTPRLQNFRIDFLKSSKITVMKINNKYDKLIKKARIKKYFSKYHKLAVACDFVSKN